MIILYGGSFNPPTMAHFGVVELLNSKYNPEKIVIMPVGCAYPKPELAPCSERFEMLKIMALKFDNVIVSDFELKQPFIGTIRALEHLEKEYNQKVALAIGADNLISLPTWIEAEKLIANYQLIVFNRTHILSRDKVKDFERDHRVKLDIIEFDYEISASKIRSNVRKYKKHLLPEVYKYIKLKGLYDKGAK